MTHFIPFASYHLSRNMRKSLATWAACVAIALGALAVSGLAVLTGATAPGAVIVGMGVALVAGVAYGFRHVLFRS